MENFLLEDDLIMEATKTCSYLRNSGQMESYYSFVEVLTDATIQPFLDSGQTSDLEELTTRYFEDEVSKMDGQDREYFDLALAIHSPLAGLEPKFRTADMFIRRIFTVDWHYAFNDPTTAVLLAFYLEGLWDDLFCECREAENEIRIFDGYPDLAEDSAREIFENQQHSWSYEKLWRLEISLNVLLGNAATFFGTDKTSKETADVLIALVQAGIRYKSLHDLYCSSDDSEDESVRLIAIGAFKLGHGCVGDLLSAVDRRIESLPTGRDSEAYASIGSGSGKSELMLGRQHVASTLASIDWLWDVIASGGAFNEDCIEPLLLLHAQLSEIGNSPTEWADRSEALLIKERSSDDRDSCPSPEV